MVSLKKKIQMEFYLSVNARIRDQVLCTIVDQDVFRESVHRIDFGTRIVPDILQKYLIESENCLCDGWY